MTVTLWSNVFQSLILLLSFYCENRASPGETAAQGPPDVYNLFLPRVSSTVIQKKETYLG